MMKKIGLPLILVLAAITFFVFQNQTRQVSIIHFNDAYLLEPAPDGKSGGFARVMTAIKSGKDKNPLIFFGGDALGGSKVSQASKGAHMIQAFNHMGVDVAVLGNHEFDFGLDELATQIKASKFEWLLANFQDKRTGKSPANVKAWTILEKNGVRVGVVGLASDWLNSIKDSQLLNYQKYLEAAKKSVQELEGQNVDVIVALTHMDFKYDEDLANQMPQIDLILGGHDHDVIQKTVNGTLVLKSGSDFQKLARVTVSLNALGCVKVKNDWVSIDGSVAEDKEAKEFVTNVLKKYSGDAGELDDYVIGQSSVKFDVRNEIIRTQESGYGNLTADSLLAYTKADVALLNGGGIRTNQVYEAGEIKKSLIDNIHPFGNKIVVLKISGAKLKEALEVGVGKYPELFGGFPHIAGMKVSFDAKAPAGQRVQEFLIDGKPLSSQKVYSLATNGFLADGGNGYGLFKALDRVNMEVTVKTSDAVIAHIKSIKNVSSLVEGRVHIKK